MRIVLPLEGQAAEPELVRAIRETLRRAAAELSVGPGDVSVRCVERDEMRALNARWRDRDRPTDVLSFPSGVVDPEGRRHIGDIAICVPVAIGQARERRHTVRQEVCLLALHGLLHLLGYDHEQDEGEMEALEQRLRPLVLSPDRGA